MARNEFDWLGEIQEVSNRLRTYFENFEGSQHHREHREHRGTTSGYAPAADLLQDNDRLLIEIELPGMTREDIRVTMSGNAIEIAGEKKARRPEGSRVLHEGRKFGAFMRRVELPANAEVDMGNASAAYENGVLRITLPRRAKDPGVSIPIS